MLKVEIAGTAKEDINPLLGPEQILNNEGIYVCACYDHRNDGEHYVIVNRLGEAFYVDDDGTLEHYQLEAWRTHKFVRYNGTVTLTIKG